MTWLHCHNLISQVGVYSAKVLLIRRDNTIYVNLQHGVQNQSIVDYTASHACFGQMLHNRDIVFCRQGHNSTCFENVVSNQSASSVRGNARLNGQSGKDCIQFCYGVSRHDSDIRLVSHTL